MNSRANNSFFVKHLFDWYEENPRPMPWLNTKDPYHIWLSEVILQQTRVAQGWAYYEKFLRHYPTIADLSEASEDEVLKDWQGLGYNSRARNLHATAQYISREKNGIFPSTYKEILSLKGVGPYTAAAISSFAYNLPYPAVDGNVKRVCARFFGIHDPIDKPATHKLIQQKAQKLLSAHPPAIFNQAIMNFGALQCTPGIPSCSNCPVKKKCVAFLSDKVSQIPVKSPRRKRQRRYFHYFVLKWEDHLILRKRTAQDIWQNMYDFPLIENKNKRNLNLREQDAFLKTYQIKDGIRKDANVSFKQALTHRIIHATFYFFQLNEKPTLIFDNDHLVEQKNLINFAFPKIITLYLKEQWSIN